MNDLIVALGLVLVIEGVMYALFPSAARRLAEELPKLEDGTLRRFGLLAVAVGLFVVWLVRG